MDPVILVLRVLHIGSAILWVGSAFTFFLFVAPSAKALTPDAQRVFMDQFAASRRFPSIVLGTGIVAVLAGAVLYWRASGGLNPGWLSSASGVGFTIGALAGISALGIAMFILNPTFKTLQALAGKVRSEGRPPTPDEGSTLGALDRRLTVGGRTMLVFMAIAVVMMETSRYLG